MIVKFAKILKVEDQAVLVSFSDYFKKLKCATK